ncbi:MAG TPA: uracil-DNA glycosylase [Alphaproteobacteria bacterium]|nr:uracil-DNA glycosylase [Alphaproteobacteria bacterium]
MRANTASESVQYTTFPEQPDRDCPLCPRLVAFRAANRAAFPAWHNAPVPSFGPLDARLLVVGLGPGLKGANRTGRPFTGDFAGDLLYATLRKFGFAEGIYQAGREESAWQGDTLRLRDVRISNSERCVPPQNKPLPAELKNCRRFLVSEIEAMPKLRVIVALGRVAHDSVLAAQGLKPSRYTFAHAAMHALPDGKVLADSYHCSRYNTNTGVLTPVMF